MKICFKKKKRPKKQEKESFLWRELNLGPTACKVNELPIAPRQLMLNRDVA